jgi:hypothetical protein
MVAWEAGRIDVLYCVTVKTTLYLLLQVYEHIFWGFS